MNRVFRRKQRAFTLVELLVVIAIICILAAILFPVFARARENARRANCMSNEKQISLGIMQYTQDYDEKLPQYCYDANMTFWWTSQIYPYTKSWQIYRCPSALSPKSSAAVNGNIYQPTYAMNGSASGLYTRAGRSLASIDSPSVTWMLVESKYPAYYETLGYGITYIDIDGAGSSSPDQGSTTFNNNIHLDGSNILFADGHVKWRKIGADITGQDWRAQ